jgi:SAM-dependent methyltransferase
MATLTADPIRPAPESGGDSGLAGTRRHSASLWLCGTAIFAGAFLLFAVQPVIAKSILPWFGGSAAVWSVCLFFFQALLLGGYLYAHLSVRFLSGRAQALLHIALAGAALAALPIIPDPSWKPKGDENPVPLILGLLASTVGLPYFVLSATSPLVQSWYSRLEQTQLPYRLFALSNLASLAALLAYPVAIEPFIGIAHQAWIWSGGFGLFALIIAIAAWRSCDAEPLPNSAGSESSDAIHPADCARWLLLAALPSALLLAVTNHLCQNVASIPFLWILPLGLYLLTFVLCFDRESVGRWQGWTSVAGAALSTLAWAQLQMNMPIVTALPLFTGGLFLLCMYCHGQLAARKPAAAHLTTFYVMLSLGGAMGSLFVSLVAPQIFRGLYELPFILSLCAVTLLFTEYRKSLVTDLLWAAVAIGVILSGKTLATVFDREAAVSGRNFYGLLRVVDSPPANAPPAGLRLMVHGTVNHGSQHREPSRRRETTTYYSPSSGVGLLMDALAGKPRRAGMVGLGVGTLAAYAEAGDVFRFYEINPLVVDYARRYFTFLGDSAGKIDVVLGDGRLALEREQPQNYDLLVIDAFSGDSIPAHLLSREAFALYYRHLAPDGVLALHVSNEHLDLAPVVGSIARSTGWRAQLIIDSTAGDGRMASIWVVVSRDLPVLPGTEFARRAVPLQPAHPRPWTDDYSNLFQALR